MDPIATPHAATGSQPQSASQEPPKGYAKLTNRAFREPGDLVWTIAGWIVCNLTTGSHPDGAVVARKTPIEAGPVHIPEERQHAPLRLRTNAEWLSVSTPLFYILQTPFEEEESRVYQLHQLKAAIAMIRSKDVAYANLYIAYLDHRTGLYDTKLLQWVEYVHDPMDSANPESKGLRKIHDPYEIYVYA